MIGTCVALVVSLSQTAVSAADHGEGAKCAVPTQRVQCGSLTCVNDTCAHCNVSVADQCYETAMECNPASHECVIGHLNAKLGTFIAAATIVIVCSVAAVAGVGGGAILVSVFVPALGIPVMNAVAFSQATITGQSLFNVFVLARRFHPDYQPPQPTRPVINWTILAFWLPISLVGTLYGNLAGKVVPDWFRMAALLLLLTYILYRVVLRVIKQRAADKARLLQREEAAAAKTAAASVSTYGSTNHAAPPVQPPPASPQFPLVPILLVCAAFFPLFIVNIIRSRVVRCGSPVYWVLIVLITLYEFALTLGYRQHLARAHHAIAMGSEDAEKVPFEWNKYSSIIFPILSSIAGGAAALLGIGGGLVLSFLLLEAKLVPQEASATSAMFTLLVAAESALQFVVQGNVPYDYGLLCFGCGIVSTCIGQFVFVKKIQEKGWSFLIVVALATIMSGSMIGTIALGIYNTVVIVQSGGSLGFGELCKA